MKRQMLVLVLISSVLLAACGGAPAPATNQPTAAPATGGQKVRTIGMNRARMTVFPPYLS